jgi:hypothetical protein
MCSRRVYVCERACVCFLYCSGIDNGGEILRFERKEEEIQAFSQQEVKENVIVPQPRTTTVQEEKKE